MYRLCFVAIILLATIAVCGKMYCGSTFLWVKQDLVNQSRPDLPLTVSIAGTAIYERPTITHEGLDFFHLQEKPIRQAVVQIRDVESGERLASTRTSNEGAFLVKAPAHRKIKIIVLAQFYEGNFSTAVLDNAHDNAIYAIFTDLLIEESDKQGILLRAATGWNTQTKQYEGMRAAAPFAILDTVNSAHNLIKSVDPTANFSALNIYWSEKNNATSIGTTHYNRASGLWIMGDANEDTDEYDSHVVAREWGHYFETEFSRSDSLEGVHGVGDILDETVAFSEGFRTAFSCMINNDAHYRDTFTVADNSLNQSVLELNIEQDDMKNANVSEFDDRRLEGAWSESSVQEMLWDCFDGAKSSATDVDQDGVELGFGPLYQVLVGAHKTTPALCSIYSFMTYLKYQNSDVEPAVVKLEENENIFIHDIYEERDRPRYTMLLATGEPIKNDSRGLALSTKVQYGPISDIFSGNKLFNRQLLKVVIPSEGGPYRLKISPAQEGDNGGDIAMRIGGIVNNYIDSYYEGLSECRDIEQETKGTIQVCRVSSFATAGVPTGATNFVVLFGESSKIPPTKPTPGRPHLPAGNG